MALEMDSPGMTPEVRAALLRAAAEHAAGAGSIGLAMRFYAEPRVILDVYVNAERGNDNHDGSTAATAMKDFDAAQRRHSQWVMCGGRIRYLLAAHSDGVTVLDYPTRGVMLYGHGIFSAGVAVVGPEMLRVAGPFSLADQSDASRDFGDGNIVNFGKYLTMSPSPGMADSAARGLFLRATRSGRLVVPEIQISDNQGAVVQIDMADIGDAVDAETDVFEIVRPAVKLTAGDATAPMVPIYGAGAMMPLPDPNVPSKASFERLAISSPNFSGFGISTDRCRFDLDDQYHIGGSVQAGSLVVSNTVVVGAGDVSFRVFGRLDGGASGASEAIHNDKSITISLFGAYLEVNDGGRVGGRNIGAYGSHESGAIKLIGSSSYLEARGYLLGGGNSHVGVEVNAGRVLLEANKAVIRGEDGDARLANFQNVSWGTGSGQLDEAAGLNGRVTTALNFDGAIYAGAPASIVSTGGAGGAQIEPSGGGGAVGAFTVVTTDGDITLTPNAIHYSSKTGSRQVLTIPDDDALPAGTWFEVWGRSATSGWQIAQPNNSTFATVVWGGALPGNQDTASGNAGSISSGDQFDVVRLVKYGSRKWQAVMLRGTPTVA